MRHREVTKHPKLNYVPYAPQMAFLPSSQWILWAICADKDFELKSQCSEETPFLSVHQSLCDHLNLNFIIFPFIKKESKLRQ